MLLVVGSTGMMGFEVARRASASGRRVRALCRRSSNPTTIDRLGAMGISRVGGDLKDPLSLSDACAGVSCVVSTASATLSRQPGDTVDTVDRHGQLALVEAAERAGVEHFIYVSIAPMQPDNVLQQAKRAVEARLRDGKMAYTILRPTCFQDIWLSPFLGFDPARGKVRVFGSGQAPVSWVALQDVAEVAMLAVESTTLRNRTLTFGGADTLSPLEVVSLLGQLGASGIELEFVPEEVLERQLAEAQNDLEAVRAALPLGIARGYVAEPPVFAPELLPRLRSVREHAMALLDSQTS